ncbi:hypothetical protein BJ742DRAFT_794812 [Cladochytrium replicatum]|nr:hypothetical protein BJ742DRAFT_794812 [Cladochytrium replicatum]
MGLEDDFGLGKLVSGCEVTVEEGDRCLVARINYKPGEVIFEETPILWTEFLSHEETSIFPTESVPYLRYDFQRLVHHFLEQRLSKDHKLFRLSRDGVTSAVAQQTFPERMREYRDAARAMLEVFKGTRSTSATLKQVEAVIQIIETNCHAAPLGNEDDDDDEDACGVYILGSMMQHSCFPNATVNLFPDNNMRMDLRATRSIRPGEPITIAYKELDHAPRIVRRAQLMRRGFICRCPGCDDDAVDWCRAVSCLCSTAGIISPKADGEHWTCNTCDRTIENKEKTEILKKESFLHCGDPTDVFVNCQDLSSLLGRLTDHYPNVLSSPPTLPDLLSLREYVKPLHPFHTHIYRAVRGALFDNPLFSALVNHHPRASLIATHYLVACNRLMSQLHTGQPDLMISEETRHHIWWLAVVASQEQQKLGKENNQSKRLHRAPKSSMWKVCDLGNGSETVLQVPTASRGNSIWSLARWAAAECERQSATLFGNKDARTLECREMVRVVQRL